MMLGLQRLLNRVWDSPTLTSWISLSARSVLLAAVLPLVITKLDANSVVLWELMLRIIGLQMIASSGFIPSFIRAIGYARGGYDFRNAEDARFPSADSADNPHAVPTVPVETDPSLSRILAQTIGTMTKLNARMAWLIFFVLATLGSLAVAKSIQRVEDVGSAWTAWAIVCVSVPITFRGLGYLAFLHGNERIPLHRRWESLFLLVSGTLAVVVLLCDGGILGLTLAYQVPAVANVLANAILCRRIAAELGIPNARPSIDADVFRFVWPAFWRSGVGMWAQVGTFQIATILATQSDDTRRVASFLMAVRLIDAVNSVSLTPFYCRIPRLVTLYAAEEKETLLSIAQRGMLYSHTAFAVGACVLAFVGPWLFRLLGASVEFPSLPMWSMLVAAFFAQRYGAMHIQLYSLTNRIIWHIANGVTGVLFLAMLYPMYNTMSFLAFPCALLIANLAFYAWYSPLHSYREFGLRFFHFEKLAALPAVAMMAATFAFLLRYNP